MSKDWKKDRTEAAIKEGTDKIMKAAQEGTKNESEEFKFFGFDARLPKEDLPYIGEVADDQQSFETCIGIGMNQFFPEYVTINLEDEK
jgi:hypothetical protein